MKTNFKVLVILMMAVVCPQTIWADETQWVEVSTVKEFLDAVKTKDAYGRYNANVRLTWNIDLSDTTFTTNAIFDFTFQGKISGKSNGFTFKIISNGNKNGSCLFNTATGALFSDLVLVNFKYDEGGNSKKAVIASESNNSTYENILVSESYISASDEVGGLVAISKGDEFINCKTDGVCEFIAKKGTADNNLGGIAGKAYNSVFSLCSNNAYIDGRYNQVGGIVAYTESCTIDRCENTGTIVGFQNVGGIVGNAKNATVITRCVNTGLIEMCEFMYNMRKTKRAGIAGVLDGSGSYVKQCMNFGNIRLADNDYGEIVGARTGGAKEWRTADMLCYYYCNYNGKHADNEDMYSDESVYRIDKVNSGEMAYKSTVDGIEGGEKWLYQELKAHPNGYTAYPVPVHTAFNRVFSNILCDGTQSYSNNYNSTSAHEPVFDRNGYCTICGRMRGSDDITSLDHIKTARQLDELAKLVNDGQDFSNTKIFLDNDIDMSELSKQTTIGMQGFPFSGTFDGQGHRIKNMHLNSSDVGVGLFGVVGGTNTVIQNVVIDSTCTVTATDDYGTGGLIGYIQGEWDTPSNFVIENCGNEATVTGPGNVAGIVGAVRGNKTVVEIINCYNTGAINGETESATICGYAGATVNITNTYNTGALTGGDDTSSFCRCENDTLLTASDNYDINGSQKGVTQISLDQARLGYLCQQLNANSSTQEGRVAWTQNLASDAVPTFGDEYLHYTRTMETANLHGTVCLPFATVSGENYNFYIPSSVSGEDLVLTKVDTLAAGTPAIIIRDILEPEINLYAANSAVVDSPVTGPSVSGLTLTGSFITKDITSEDGYIIDDNLVKKISTVKSLLLEKVLCNPFHAYLAGKIASGAKLLNIVIDTPSGIDEIIDGLNGTNGMTGDIYDLNGRRLTSLQKGVNIIRLSNGKTKKVIVK